MSWQLTAQEGKKVTVLRFNIRVYGIWINTSGELLVTDEYRYEKKMTKFPGGGLQAGEGTVDCLKRECFEELGQPVEVLEHFYTTDFFQPSAFDEQQQLVSVYYYIKTIASPCFEVADKPFDIEAEEGAQSFRWVPVSSIVPEDFTWPVDQKVAEMIRKEYLE